MSLLANQITIAVPLFKRRQFIKQAVASALNQSIPVRVVVVEDPGPDPTLESFVKKEFGPKIDYVKGPKWRGQFGNLNLCLNVCATEWISILHDDDYLAPGFVEAMMELEGLVPGQAIYRGQTIYVDEHGQPTDETPFPILEEGWQRIGVRDLLYCCFPFPGQLFKVSMAKDLGGFRETSCLCGDGEMWARLTARGGAVQTAKTVAYCRSHDSWDRVSNAAVRNGRGLPSTIVNFKRLLSLLPADSRPVVDRTVFLNRGPLPVRFLLRYGASLRPRLLAYHVGLLLRSRPPHWRYAVFQQCARVGGVGFVGLCSRLWNLMRRS